MRLVRRLILVVIGSSVPAVVASIGCSVQSDRFPGLPNEVPNGTVKGGSGTSSGSTTTTSSSGGATTLCQCGADISAAGTCAACAGDAVKTGGACEVLGASCTADTTCQQALTALHGCAAGATQQTCIESAIQASPLLESLLKCQCTTACGAQCASAAPLACNIGTGGAGTGGAGTGGAGTGGVPADAGDGG